MSTKDTDIYNAVTLFSDHVIDLSSELHRRMVELGASGPMMNAVAIPMSQIHMRLGMLTILTDPETMAQARQVVGSGDEEEVMAALTLITAAIVAAREPTVAGDGVDVEVQEWTIGKN